jgi:ABC-type dipeptide/oligopeptide/nickel transport system ATPase subunit
MSNTRLRLTIGQPLRVEAAARGGAAASGKSTSGTEVARRLGLLALLALMTCGCAPQGAVEIELHLPEEASLSPADERLAEISLVTSTPGLATRTVAVDIDDRGGSLSVGRLEVDLGVRLAVFVEEQGIPREEELDELDEVAVHCVGYAVDTPVAAGRLVLSDGYGKVGRMAVLREHRGAKRIAIREFNKLLDERAKAMDFDPDLMKRSVNEGFSGGEKKRNEILQLSVLDPKLALLDETDSGLDIDALKTVAGGINALRTPERGVLLITHYQRLLNYIKPDVVHVMIDGRIAKTGGAELALELESQGYQGYRPAVAPVAA